MFTGKKIASSGNMPIEPVHGKISTKVTEQIIGKRKDKQLNETQSTIKNQGGETKQKPCLADNKSKHQQTSKVNKNGKAQRQNSKQKQSDKSANKLKKQVKTILNDKKVEKTKVLNKNQKKIPITKLVNLEKQIQKQQKIQQNHKQLEDCHEDDLDEKELSGEHNFIQYQCQQQQMYERVTPVPIGIAHIPQFFFPQPQQEPPQSELEQSKVSEYCELGLSMDVFEMEVDEIMAKQYFVV